MPTPAESELLDKFAEMVNGWHDAKGLERRQIELCISIMMRGLSMLVRREGTPDHPRRDPNA
jgi:hypothetical protein